MFLKKIIIKTMAVCLIVLTPVTKAFSEEQIAAPGDELVNLPEPAWLQTMKLIDYELLGVTGFVTYLGVKSWDWGSSRFKFNDEGWFSADTGSGGQDKLGHFYSSYIMAEFLYTQARKARPQGMERNDYPGLYAWLIMLYVEVFDGVSKDHGFSYEDLIMNSSGIGLAMLRDRYPKLAETMDFRIEYSPKRFVETKHPITDYMNQRYMVVLKPAGFDSLADTPLKYFEFSAGYFARGFKNDDPEIRETFVGVGLNLNELLFKPATRHFSYAHHGNDFFNYVQVPETYLRYGTSRKESGGS
ncbi:DUF2279 domain-containing protein [Pseudobacteriovorax antillogorgiicola]|uniref:Predicted lipoprotein n=1 Tax=Pseudobacteriovorax antillogorgiicola TaxID=1513793 RepID=A0A1Y6C736_9BACT|nr:DUF2279 domain-containing protein [Pseudobacteriovorax antillogorgiicola]TCS50637.1 putative lipoprotein DUF2279 [Pseudobacteriovorax antillogorgiicola]SMF39529.1 Predicted lipoprotein [Pseudobacteriovorax antillogorgiicola]